MSEFHVEWNGIRLSVCGFLYTTEDLHVMNRALEANRALLAPAGARANTDGEPVPVFVDRKTRVRECVATMWPTLASMVEIAQTAGVHTATVRRIARELGLPLRYAQIRATEVNRRRSGNEFWRGRWRVTPPAAPAINGATEPPAA